MESDKQYNPLLNNKISANLLMIDVRGEVDGFIKRIETYFERLPGITIKKGRGESTRNYRLFSEEGHWFGQISLRRLEDKQVRIWADRIVMTPDYSNTNDSGIIQLRQIIPEIIDVITENLSSTDILAIVNKMDSDNGPLTEDENNEIKEKEGLKQELLRSQGIYSRVILEAIFESKPTLIWQMAEIYYLPKIIEGNDFWNVYAPKGSLDNVRYSQKGFYLSGKFPHGFIGQIDFNPLGQTTWLKITTASNVINSDSIEAKVFYFQAVDELTQLAQFLLDRIPTNKIITYPPKYIPTFVTGEEQNHKSGIAPSIWYDLAFNHKTKMGLSHKKAFDWMKEQIEIKISKGGISQDDQVKELIDTFYTTAFERFKSAMRYRNRLKKLSE